MLIVIGMMVARITKCNAVFGDAVFLVLSNSPKHIGNGMSFRDTNPF
jgi:hypothetical protein